ncbi:filamentous hemagglutinin N-terminal domain-containing protein [Leptolyngbya sp. PCC 6406]|uniref:two-partner secretion domain-containing protein n=1 Tax=Leptolyngbya sp. PCC 6406 TaxID=1173264 RepID=UPI0002ABD1CE|nr:filamentous hemagglutinin N-terminal domain-containing protein [Leptolyngbya sp. PCC 6406]
MRIAKKESIALAFMLLGLSWATPVQSQEITPTNDGTGTTVNFDAVTQTYTINGGTQIDANLFHSFQQFGLSTGEIANFLANPSVVNILARVTGGQASVIDGLLQVSGGSNANLFLINPAGILLGRNASLNLAGSFSASTASGIAFGDEIFSASGQSPTGALGGAPSGYVFLGNEGILLNEADLQVAPGQGITLAGGTVVNTDTLTAPSGTVSIVAVPEAGILQISQAGLVLSLALPTAQVQALAAGNGFTPLALPALLAGEWGGNATTVSTRSDGAIVLSSGAAVNPGAGATTVAGTVDVSGSQGGQIQVLGQEVALSGATLTATGNQGGGAVLVGGDYLGQGAIPTAQTTQVDATSRIEADALDIGNGGRVIVWADGDTVFGGQISAQGGAQGGDGGFVETSGAGRLTVQPGAQVFTAAPQGDWGTWLLDPLDLVVEVGGTATITGGTNDPLASTIDATTIVTALGGSNVTLQATNSIRVDAAINSSSGRNLTLASPTVNLNQPITLGLGGRLFGTAGTVNVGASGSVRNGLDVAAAGATVNIAAGTFTEASTLEIWRPVTLTGAGAGNTILSGNNTHRVLEVRTTFTGTVTLNDLTVANGNPALGSGGGFLNLSYPTVNLVVNNSTFRDNQANSPVAGGGGAIASNGPVVINNSNITNNFSGGVGGGINAVRGLVLNNTTVSNNTATGAGGGIHSWGTATLNNSTVSGNRTLVGLPNANGGGISARAPLTLNNTTVTGNSSIRHGGGIAGFGAGTIQVNGSTISNNTTALDGGGIYDSSGTTIVLVGSTVSGNTAGNDGGGLRGGSLFLSNSTISSNRAGQDGGGIYSTSPVTNNFVLNNTTVSGNTADRNGGGIYSRNLTLNNATIAFNRADGDNNGVGDGGGIAFLFNNNNIIRNSIIAGNSSSGGAASDILGGLGITQFTHSLIQTTAGITSGVPVDGVNGNVVGQAPLLAALANNGGPTQTHELLAGSLAIDGSNADAIPTDQRGAAAVGVRDMGAFESGLTTIVTNPLLPPVTPPGIPPSSVAPSALPSSPLAAVGDRPDHFRVGRAFLPYPEDAPRPPILTIDPAFAAELGLDAAPNPPVCATDGDRDRDDCAPEAVTDPDAQP